MTDGDELLRKYLHNYKSSLPSNDLDPETEWSNHIQPFESLARERDSRRLLRRAPNHRATRLITVALFVVGIGTLATFLATNFVSHLSPGGTGASAAKVNKSALEQGRCRSVPMHLSSVTHEPDGTIVYHFVGSGEASNEYLPSKSFDPFRATNAELVANGFPSRPSHPNSVAYAAWKKAVQHIEQEHATVTVPVVTVGPGCFNPGEPPMTKSQNSH
jgi:hypothetical protein